jgi:hypothetical protein
VPEQLGLATTDILFFLRWPNLGGSGWDSWRAFVDALWRWLNMGYPTITGVAEKVRAAAGRKVGPLESQLAELSGTSIRELQRRVPQNRHTLLTFGNWTLCCSSVLARVCAAAYAAYRSIARRRGPRKAGAPKCDAWASTEYRGIRKYFRAIEH